MGIGMGYAIGAAAVTGKPVVAIKGDSAFGFSGMEIETICRYELPVTTVVFNNNGVYRGDPKDRPYSPTGLLRDARYDKIIEAFDGAGFVVSDHEGAGLRRGEVIETQRRHLAHAELTTREQPAVTGDNIVLAISKSGKSPTASGFSTSMSRF